MFVSNLVLHALRNAILRDNGAVHRQRTPQRGSPGEATSAWAVHQTINRLHKTLARGDLIKQSQSPMPFIQLILVLHSTFRS